MASHKQADGQTVASPLLKLRSLLSLHRRMGIISAVFVILLSMSGLVLHHSATLNLDNTYIASEALLNWYGIEVPELIVSYGINGHTSSQIADAVYFDGKRLPGTFNPLRGMIEFELGFALATSNQLLLLTPDGDLIETLSAVHGVPSNIRQIGKGGDSGAYIEDLFGISRVDFSGPVFLALDLPPSSPALNWSLEVPLEPGRGSEIRRSYAASLLSWERLVLDVHSGRLLGGAGVVLVDIMAILFVLMAATGVWIWTRRRT